MIAPELRKLLEHVLDQLGPEATLEQALRALHEQLGGPAPVAHALQERVKELTALHASARLLQNEGLPLERLLSLLVELLPPAFQYPEITAARVRYGEQSFQTRGFAASPYSLSASFRAADGRAGALEVVYLEKRPRAAEGPFLSEERKLLDSLTDLLQVALNRRIAEEGLRASQLRLDLAMSAADLAVAELDMTNGRVSWSPAMERLTGVSAQTFGGTVEAMFQLVHEADRDGVRRTLEAVLTDPAQQDRYEVEYRMGPSPRNMRWFVGKGQVLRNAARQPERVVGVVYDVTARKSLEEQLRHTQKMEAVGRLAGGIAHDFNNLLTAVMGNCHLLHMQLSDAAALEMVDDVRDAAERGSRLTHQLLAFSRRSVTQPVAVDLNALIRQIERMLRRLVGEDIQLTTTLAPKLGRIQADPGQLEQVLMNLVVNARDALEVGGQLELQTREQLLDAGYVLGHPDAHPGWHVVLSVRDSGCGMTDEVRAHMFEPFFTTKEPGRGTGLGLSVVFGIVKQSGGHLEVESAPGAGSTFSLFFPRIDAPAHVAPKSAIHELPTGHETVLLVEDESTLRRLLRSVLQSQGYHVIDAPSGPEALELLRDLHGPVDLILSDVVLPGMPGRQLAAAVRMLHPRAKLLFFSGYADDALARSGVTRDADLMQKPFSPSDLARRVRQVLDATQEKSRTP
ncbi:MAG TPA: ATP-binding protein [Polyangiales bacterium]|nr:ATP-binding protein [Polyangiales bacterium]